MRRVAVSEGKQRDRQITMLRVIIGGLFLAAAGMKTIHAGELAAVLSFLLSLNRDAPIAGALGITGLEAFIGVTLVLGCGKRWPVALAFVTLLVFSTVLVKLLATPDAPGCGCFGIAGAAESSVGDALVGLVRNSLMLVVLACLWTESRPHAEKGERATAAASDPRQGTSARAFSLVEVLVSFVVMAILVSLALPALAGAKGAALNARSLSMHRQLVQVVTLYAGDSKDAFPYFQTPGHPRGPMRLPGFVLARDVGYFSGGSWYWPNLLRGTYIDDGTSLHVGLPNAGPSNATDGYPLDTIRSRYWLTHTVFADPMYWVPDEAPRDRRLLRATHQAEVEFPSRKGLFLDTLGGLFSPLRVGRATGGTNALIGRADGSAGVLFWDQQDPRLVVERPHGARAWQVMSTRGGLRGWDE